MPEPETFHSHESLVTTSRLRSDVQMGLILLLGLLHTPGHLVWPMPTRARGPAFYMRDQKPARGPETQTKPSLTGALHQCQTGKYLKTLPKSRHSCTQAQTYANETAIFEPMVRHPETIRCTGMEIHSVALGHLSRALFPPQNLPARSFLTPPPRPRHMAQIR